MGDMMDDINKFAKIWDDAVQKGIFNSAPSPKEDQEEERGTDFFGQYKTDEYDRDKPLNEVDAKYWKMLSKEVGVCMNEQSPSSAALKASADAIGNSQNPVLPNTVGKDQELNVTSNWAMGGKEIEELEKLKVELHELESKLNSLMSKEEAKPDPVQVKIESLKKEIDKLSDSLSGNRFDPKSA
jgi:hypothetical protein